MGIISIVDLRVSVFGTASIVVDWVSYVGLLRIVAIELVCVCRYVLGKEGIELI